MDTTPARPSQGLTELGELERLKSEFEARRIKIYAISCADSAANEDWLKDVHSATGYSVSFPIIHDSDFEICKRLGMLPPSGQPDDEARLRDLLRGVYLVDTMKRVRVIMHYPASVGWSSYEILRAFDALFRADAQLACPVNWIARPPASFRAYSFLRDRPTDRPTDNRAGASRRRRRAATPSSSPTSRRPTRSATSRAASGPSRSRPARTTSASRRTR